MRDFEQISVSFKSEDCLALIKQYISDEYADEVLVLEERRTVLLMVSGLMISSYSSYLESDQTLEQWLEEADIYDRFIAAIVSQLEHDYPLWVPLVFVPMDLNGMIVAVMGRSNELQGLPLDEPAAGGNR